MNVSRRKFMKAGIMVAAFAGIPLTAQITTGRNASSGRAKALATIKPSALTQPDLAGYYNKSTFAPYVGTEFRVKLDASKAIRIKLVQVRDLAGSGNGERSFSLLFAGPKGKTFPQRTYEVEHAALGKFSLFLVPVGLRTETRVEYYEAVFNRS